MARGPGKGNTNNPAGKPAGTKNTKTKQWEALGAKIVGEGAERFMSILDGLPDDDFTKNYLTEYQMGGKSRRLQSRSR